MGLIPAFDFNEWKEEHVEAEDVLSGGFPGGGAFVVYFIQAGDSYEGAVKVGITGNVGNRFAALQRAHYEELYIRLICHSIDTLSQHPARELEKHLHRAFKPYRIKGEWFRPEGEVLKFMTDPASCLETFAYFPYLGHRQHIELMRMGYRA